MSFLFGGGEPKTQVSSQTEIDRAAREEARRKRMAMAKGVKRETTMLGETPPKLTDTNVGTKTLLGA